MVVHNVKEHGVEFSFTAGACDQELVTEIPKELKHSPEMDVSPRSLSSVTVKGEPDETDMDLPFKTSLKTELVDFKETVVQELVPKSPKELKYSPSMALSAQPFRSVTVKSEAEEVDTDLSFQTLPKTEEIIIRELVPEFPRELKYSLPVDLSAHPFTSEAVKIEPEEVDTDLSFKISEEEDIKTEMPDDNIDGNISDGTSPNCASSLPSSSGGVGEFPAIGNSCTSKDEITAHYLCSVCKIRFQTQSRMRRHIHSYHKIECKDVVFSCSVCNKMYVNRIEFTKHILKFHPRVDIHICPVCRETFRTCWGLHEHLFEYDDDDSYSCPRCAQMFPNRANLQQYVQIEHEYTTLICIEF